METPGEGAQGGQDQQPPPLVHANLGHVTVAPGDTITVTWEMKMDGHVVGEVKGVVVGGVETNDNGEVTIEVEGDMNGQPWCGLGLLVFGSPKAGKAYYSKGAYLDPSAGYVGGSTVMGELRWMLPELDTVVACPNSYLKMPASQRVDDKRTWLCSGHDDSIGQLVQHLNDSCGWSREQVADWLETLDADLTFPTEPPPPPKLWFEPDMPPHQPPLELLDDKIEYPTVAQYAKLDAELIHKFWSMMSDGAAEVSHSFKAMGVALENALNVFKQAYCPNSLAGASIHKAWADELAYFDFSGYEQPQPQTELLFDIDPQLSCHALASLPDPVASVPKLDLSHVIPDSLKKEPKYPTPKPKKKEKRRGPHGR